MNLRKKNNKRLASADQSMIESGAWSGRKTERSGPKIEWAGAERERKVAEWERSGESTKFAAQISLKGDASPVSYTHLTLPTILRV